MVLKRLIFTALGALGVGALASGPAYSQQIPGPKLFTDITTCGGGMLPTPSTAMGAANLFGAMGLVETALGVDAATDAGVIGEAEKKNLLGLLIVGNCNNPVGNGIATAATLYEEYQTAKNALPSSGTPDADTQREYDTALANRNAIAGPVYDRVFDQRAKLADANKAIDAYNKLAGMSGEYATFKEQYDDLNFDLWGLRDRDDNDLVGAQLEAERTKAYGQGARGFKPLNGNNDPGDTMIDGTEFEDAFDASGNLRFHPTSDADVASTGVSLILDKFGELDAELKKWTDFAAMKKSELDVAIRDGNLNLAPLRENVRRADEAVRYVKGERDRLLRIGKAYNYPLIGSAQFTVGTGTAAETIEDQRTLLNRYEKSGRDLTAAANAVRSGVRALDNANKALMTQLASAESYLGQLVTLREYEQRAADKAVTDGGGADAPQYLKDAADAAAKAVTAAKGLREQHMELTGSPDSPAGKLLTELLKPEGDTEDDGLALVNAVSETHKVALDAKTKADEVADMIGDGGGVAANTESITELDGRVATNENDLDQAWKDLYGTERGVDGQHDDLPACDATGVVNVATCADQRSRHNEATLEDHEMKLMQKKQYIDNLAAEIGVDPVTGEGTMDGYSRIDHNEMRSMANSGMIETNAGNIKTNADNIAAEAMNRMDADMMLAGGIDANKMRLDTHEMLVGQNTSAISALDGRVGSNESAIQRNSGMIGELSESLEVVRAGVAASMALAGMPAVNGRGIAIGVGSFDGESAFAVGFQIQGEQSSFKVGVTSSGGATGASAGVGFNF